jgi:tRNA (cytidine/uridine-2'-O-)-methyltransferase
MRFQEWRQADQGRLVLATTKAADNYTEFQFLHGDIIMTGRESAGVPDSVHEAADARIRIPMRSHLRSINVAVAASMLLGEALRQTSGFPAEPQGD